MMLKTSSAKLNPAKSFFLHTLKKQTPVTLLVTAFSLLICPGFIISQLIEASPIMGVYTYDEETRQEIIFNSLYFFIATFVVSVGLLLLLLILNYKFLYSKKAGDMYCALPLTRNELMFTSVAASAIGAIFCLTVGFVSLAIINLLPLWEGIALLDILKVYGAGLLLLVFLAAFSLIFIISGGREADTIISLVGVTVGIPAIYGIGMLMYSSVAYGVTADITPIMYTSPFIYAVMKFVFLTSFISNSYQYSVEENIITDIERFDIVSVISVAVLTALFLYIASKLFRVRKSETAGEGYSFKFMPMALSVICAIVGGFLIGIILGSGNIMSIIYWIAFSGGAILCSIAFGAVYTRGFKTVKASVLRGVIAIALSLSVMVATAFIGVADTKYLPEKDDIAKISINDGEVVFEDNLDIVLNLHNAFIEEYEQYEQYNTLSASFFDYSYHTPEKPYSAFLDNISNLDIEYILKDGSVIAREYYSWNIDYTKVCDAAFAYLTSEEVINGYYKMIEDDRSEGILQNEEPFWITYFSQEEDMYYEGNIDYEAARKIIDAYAAELKQADISVFEEECSSFSYSGFDSWFNICIPESFTNTINTILQHTEIVQ